MKRRLVSMCLAVMLVGGLSLSSMQEVRAAGNKVIDGSELTHDEESIGYDTKITRGEDLMTVILNARSSQRQDICWWDDDCKTCS